MKAVYPIVLSQGKSHIVVYVPDFNINTQGASMADAMEMARDAIGIIGVDMEDEKQALPQPSKISDIKAQDEQDIVVLVDVDFAEYRRQNDLRTIKKNCTVPAWLCYQAEQAGLNFSAVLQAGLRRALNLAGREGDLL